MDLDLYIVIYMYIIAYFLKKTNWCTGPIINIYADIQLQTDKTDN